MVEALAVSDGGKIRRCLDWLGLLARAAGRLMGQRSDRPVCRSLFEVIAPELGLDVMIHRRIEEHGLEVVVAEGLSAAEERAVRAVPAGGAPTRALREGRAVRVDDLQETDDPALALERSIGLTAYACLPLSLDGRPRGTLCFGRRQSARFDDEEMVFIGSLAAYVALADEHLRARQSMEASERRLRLAQDLAGVGSFDWDLLTGEGSASGGAFEIFGNGQVTPTYATVLKLVLPEDAGRLRDDVDASLRSGETFKSEFRIVRPDDERVAWLRADGGIVRDDAGRAVRMMGIVRDVTERRQAQEREHLLTREVDHRAKNLLTVVQSVVQLTRARDIAEFVEAVSGRIQALGRAHSLLAASRWEGAELTTLIDEETAPFVQNADRLRAEGPPVKLKPAAAQSVALVLHELVTNAAKYGALSVAAGRIDLRWSVQPKADDQLTLRWCESGGPPVRPPSRQGFGTTVIKASVDRQLGGSVSYEWPEEGLRCEIVLPAKQLVLSAPQRSPAEPRTPAQAAAPSNGVNGARVLVVEDEPLIALQVSQILENGGCSIVGPAASIGEALELVQTNDFDFALLDVDLGGSRSYPLADVLTERGRPFAFMTGFTAAELPERFRGAKMLPKPLCPSEIENVVRSVPVDPRPPTRPAPGSPPARAASPSG